MLGLTRSKNVLVPWLINFHPWLINAESSCRHSSVAGLFQDFVFKENCGFQSMGVYTGSANAPLYLPSLVLRRLVDLVIPEISV